jgi:hypothetical protein
MKLELDPPCQLAEPTQTQLASPSNTNLAGHKLDSSLN